MPLYEIEDYKARRKNQTLNMIQNQELVIL